MTSINNTLGVVKRQMDTEMANIASSNIDGVSRKKTIAEQIVVSGKLSGFRASTLNYSDNFERQRINKLTSTKNYATAIRSELKNVFDSVGAVSPNKLIGISQPLQNLFKSMNLMLQAPLDASRKNSMISYANDLSASIKSISDMLNNISTSVQSKLGDQFDAMSSEIAKLQDINLDIVINSHKGNDVTSFIDQRNTCIANISNFVGVKEQYISGALNLSSGSTTLMSNDNHKSFTFYPTTNMDDLNNAKLNSLIVKSINQDGSVSGVQEVDNIQDMFDGSGSIGGYLNLYLEEIPKMRESLNVLSLNVSEQFNRIHNQGCGVKGRNLINATRPVKLAEKMDWSGSGSVRIAVMSSATNKVVTDVNGSNVMPFDFEIGKLRSSKNESLITAADIAHEINEHFSPTPCKEIKVGAIGNKQALISDVKLVSGGKVGNTFSFDLTMSNTSAFDAKVLVTGVSIGGNANRLLTDSNSFAVPSGAAKRTHELISLDVQNLTGNQTIALHVRVVGDDGQIKNGIISYDINLNDVPDVNGRIAGYVVNALGNDAVEGDMIYRSVASASLIAQDGGVLDTNHSGVFQLSASGASSSIIVQDGDSRDNMGSGISKAGRGFGHFFGFNNFFVEKEIDGKYFTELKVRDDIAKDSSFISTTKIDNVQSNNYTAHVVGSKAASTTLYFTSNTLADYVNADIDVSGITYTIVNGAEASSRQISISNVGNLAALLQKISSRVSNDKKLMEVLKTTASNNAISFESKILGDDANNLFVHGTGINNVFALSAVDVQNNAFTNDTNKILFTGGESSQKNLQLSSVNYYIEASDTSTLFDMYKLSTDPITVFGGGIIPDLPMNFVNMGTTITGLITKPYTKYDDMYATYDTSSKVATKAFKEQNAPNKDEALANMLGLQQSYVAEVKGNNIMTDSTQKFLENVRG